MKQTKFKLIAIAGTMVLVFATGSVMGQVPVIASFGRNGELVCTNLQPGSTASVEWASSVLGPWTNTWTGLGAGVASSNGTVRMSVPMFYRVRGVPTAPAGMVLVPAGSFIMGDALDEDGSALPLHTVQVSAFYMDRYEMTKALWDAVYHWAITNGYNFNSGSVKATNHPLQSINWIDAVKWCNARSEKEGRQPAYYMDAGQTQVYRSGDADLSNDCVKWNSGYRLPTEAEWERAARGGASGLRFPWGNTISWSEANYEAAPSAYTYDVNPTNGLHPAFDDGEYPHTNPVGYFAPNGYGLYDMAGNVWELCWDWYDERYYSNASQIDPRGPDVGSGRVDRGGSSDYFALGCRVANRGYVNQWGSYNYLGFRSVLPQSQP